MEGLSRKGAKTAKGLFYLRPRAFAPLRETKPGKVLKCSLGAKGWGEPGKLGKDGVVFYRVIIADETDAGASTHVGECSRRHGYENEKELPRKKRSAEAQ